MTNHDIPRVVIIGAGFGGLNAARALAKAPVKITLIDRRNYHTFQPLLYQVATAGLSPGEIAAPIRSIFRSYKNVEVLMAEVTGFDLERRMVETPDAEIPYDYLIVAAGASHAYFGHDDWEPFAPGLKTIEDALEIRRRVLLAFELAERQAATGESSKPLNFVVVGGGPTGVELAGTLAEICHHALAHEFRSIDPARTHILLVEGGPRVLATYPEDLSRSAQEQLQAPGSGSPHVGVGDPDRSRSSPSRRHPTSRDRDPVGRGSRSLGPRQEAGRADRSSRTRVCAARPQPSRPSRSLRHRRSGKP